MVSVAGLLLSVGTSFAIFTSLVFLHLWLSSYKAYEYLYFPARPKRKPTKIFDSWITALSISSVDLGKVGGLDASIYLQFLETGLCISCAAAIFGVLILLPTCASDNFYVEYNSRQEDPKNKISYDTLDILSMGNVSRTSPRIWVFVVGAWWITASTCFFLHRTSRSISRQLSEFYKASSEIQHSVVLVRDIPQPLEGQSQTEHVEAYFRKLYPENFVACLVIGPIRKAHSAWNALKQKAEKLQQAKAEAEADASRSDSCHCLPPPSVASVAAMEAEAEKLLGRWRQERATALKVDDCGAAFVLFSSRVAACHASQTLLSPLGDSWRVTPAPDPRSVRWQDLTVSVYNRALRRFFAWSAVAVIVIFYLIPASFVSALANVASLEQRFRFLSPILEIPHLKQVVDAYLPQIALQQFLSLVPFTLRLLSAMEGHPSECDVLQSASGSIFLFLVLNVFLGVTISGTLFSSLQNILQQPAHVFELLGSSVPSNAAFFVSYVALIFYVSHGLELSQVIPLLQQQLFGCRGEKRTAPSYHLLIPRDLLIMTLGLCYAVISPIILPFMALYFGFALLVYRHQFLNVYLAPWESEGSLWPLLHSRVLASLFISHLTLIGYFGLNESLPTLCLLPLPALTSLFACFEKKRYGEAFEHVPLEAVHESEVRV